MMTQSISEISIPVVSFATLVKTGIDPVFNASMFANSSIAESFEWIAQESISASRNASATLSACSILVQKTSVLQRSDAYFW